MELAGRNRLKPRLNRTDTDERYHKEINPKGFANHFNAHVEISETFQKRFDARRYLVDGETYAELATRLSNETSGLALQKADTQPMPVHVPLDQKSPRVVALQLIKRFRDKRYRKHDDHALCGSRQAWSPQRSALGLSANVPFACQPMVSKGTS